MQYLNFTDLISLLFGHKIQIRLKEFLFCKRNPYGLYIFLVAIIMHHTYSMNPAF